MDRNTVIGFVLIGAILITFSIVSNKNRKEKEEKKKAEQEQVENKTDGLTNNQDTPASPESHDATNIAVVDTAEQDSIDTIEANGKYGEFSSSSTGEEKLINIENDLLKVRLSNKGGKIYSVELKNYFTHDLEPLILFDSLEQSFNYLIPIQNNQTINTENFYFETDDRDFIVAGDEEKSITFRLTGASGHVFEQKYTFKGNSYLIDYDLHLVGFDEVIPEQIGHFNLQWSTKIRKLERDLKNEKLNSTICYQTGDDFDNISYRKPKEEKLNDELHWISFKQQFFNSTLIAKGLSNAVNVNVTGKDDTVYVKTMTADIFIVSTDDADQNYAMQFYFAPNSYRELKKLDIGLQKIIPLGGIPFRFVKYFNRLLIIPTFNFLEKFIDNYALIILILTLLIKLILTPLTLRSSLAAAKMKVLKPELDELKEKYKGDQQKFGVEQMALYKKAGVNPLGGCLPMLLQMPFLVAMYYFFPASIELRQEGFLWVKDFATYDSILTFSKLPLIGWTHLSLMTLLMTITSILSAKFTTQVETTSQMKYMMYFFPVFLMFLFNSFPAALTFYYLLQNILSIGQIWIIKKYFIDEEAIHRQIQENKKKVVKKGAFQQRLEDLQKKQKQRKK